MKKLKRAPGSAGERRFAAQGLKGSKGAAGSEGKVSPLRSDEFYNQRYVLSFPPSSRHPEP
jgi:hypothetical protein